MKGNNAKKQPYEIIVRGHLDPRYAGWFEGMALTLQAGGTTTLRGQVTDQAALHGLLGRIRDLGLVLIAVRCLEDGDDDNAQQGDNHETHA